MPRISKGRRESWSFFRSPEGRIKYNAQCRTCTRSCKQSFRAVIVCCPRYDPKSEFIERITEEQK